MVHCTIQDWAKFIADQLRGARREPGFLSPQAYTMLLTNYGGDYSLGWALVEGDWAGGIAYQHAGSNGIYYAEAWVVPNLNLAAMVVANAAGSNTADAAKEAIEKVGEMIMVPVISE